MNKIDIQCLGQAIDSTFGRSSTPKTASYSVKTTFAGPDMLSVSYAAIVNFGTERDMIHMKRVYENEAREIIGLVVKHIKESYKELAGSTIKMTLRDPVDSIEIINVNNNCNRTAYYRSKCLVEVG